MEIINKIEYQDQIKTKILTVLYFDSQNKLIVERFAVGPMPDPHPE